MRFTLHVMLALLMLTQVTLASADAHVLHEASGETAHKHHTQRDAALAELFLIDQAEVASIVSSAEEAVASDDNAHLSSAEKEDIHHGCQHCCHGHNIKSLTAASIIIERPLSVHHGFYKKPFTSLTTAPDSPPPIV